MINQSKLTRLLPNRVLALFAVTAAVVLGWTASAGAATVTSASDSGPGSLRAVVATAEAGDTVDFDASLEGQTILLTSGAIDVDKSLTIEGPGASELTIDAGHASQILAITAGDLSISGLTFVNAAGSKHGGAIAQTGTGSLSVSGCSFIGNTAGGAGGSADSSNAGHGGAIYVSPSSGPTSVSDSFFSGNAAGGAGGAGFQSGLGSGGAVWDAGESLTVSGSTFTDNTAGGSGGGGAQSGNGAGGAIQKSGGFSLIVSGSEFTGNTAGGTGGGENNSGRGHGGAIYVSEPSPPSTSLSITDSSFSGNAAGGTGGEGLGSGMGEGGAVEHYSEGPLTVSGTTFEDNRAGGAGGVGGAGLFGPGLGSGGGHGGAILVVEHAPTISISGSSFIGNTGGGDGASGFLSGRGEGGAIASYGGGSLTIAGSVFGENAVGGAAGSGSGSGRGAGGAIETTGGGSLTVTDSTFRANTVSAGAGGSGGAINMWNKSLNVSGSTFAGNVVGGAGGGGSGGAIDAGAVSSLEVSASISDSTLFGNYAGGGGASGRGGAIDISDMFSAVLASVTINGNAVGPGGTGAGIHTGGGASPEGAVVTAKATIVSGNTGATNCDVPVFSSSYSLEGPSAGDTSCGFKLPSADPLLEPLADNGGPTETQALAAASPAVDAVPAANCPTKVDQRGEPRPDNGKSVCDVGAFELQDPPVAPAITSAAAVTFRVDEAGSFTVAATGLPAPALSATGALPSGVGFVDNGDGSASISGTPAGGTQGSYPITVKASNGTAPDAEQSFVLTVQAPPPTPFYKLAVGLAGDGAGTVTAAGDAISCPPACSQSFPAGTQVQLSASPAPGSVFAGWSGACAGTGTCQPALAADTTLVARFEKAAPVPAQLRIRRVRARVERKRVKVVVAGTIAKAARGVVRLTVGARVNGRRLSVTRRAKISDGRWRIRLPLAGLDAGDAATIRASAGFRGSAGVDSARAKRSTRFGY